MRRATGLEERGCTQVARAFNAPACPATRPCSEAATADWRAATPAILFSASLLNTDSWYAYTRVRRLHRARPLSRFKGCRARLLPQNRLRQPCLCGRVHAGPRAWRAPACLRITAHTMHARAASPGPLAGRPEKGSFQSSRPEHPPPALHAMICIQYPGSIARSAACLQAAGLAHLEPRTCGHMPHDAHMRLAEAKRKRRTRVRICFPRMFDPTRLRPWRLCLLEPGRQVPKAHSAQAMAPLPAGPAPRPMGCLLGKGSATALPQPWARTATCKSPRGERHQLRRRPVAWL